ncbi:polysaccharide biosynthesis/export family protein [Pseudoalteromonas luteoviolacea]|uniref:polysaccharide export protein n=1 Tax=Pseudoalteromonas luteoviolacea TaxID=43657 RepID=UPI001EED6926|nr:polysaccharide export protein [Pseudoalteromonas luteoviolacea]MCF6439058.1 polysaccharide biosynthesis/export family protein [Pseudoalteromonas luteoviolacea]
MAQCFKKLIAASITSTCIFAMSGCTIIPGGHLEGINSEEQSANLEQELSKVNIQLISPALIADKKKRNLKSQAQFSTSTSQLSDYEYRLGIGDVISIGVWDHPELTIPAAVQRTAEFDGFRVQADGTITYAYAPKVEAAGKTVSELHSEIVKRLSRVIEDPQVDIKIVAYKSQKAYVTGEVNKPGIYAITEIPLTLIDAINLAGGLTDRADWKTVAFTSDEKTEVIYLDEFYSAGDISQNRVLKSGDIVHVSRNDRRNVYVMGDVMRAGKVGINRYGLSLAEALADSGGINERSADPNGIFVLRKRNLEKDGIIADVYQLHAKNMTSMILAEQFKLEPQDIIYVTSAPISRWNKVLSLLLPSITTIDSIQDIQNQ